VLVFDATIGVHLMVRKLICNLFVWALANMKRNSNPGSLKINEVERIL